MFAAGLVDEVDNEMSKKKRLPRKIAGIRVPKFLRKSSVLRTVLASSVGREIAARALTAAAGAAAAVLIQDRSEIAGAGKKAARKGSKAVGLATEAVQSAASAVMGVVTDAASSIMPDDKPKDGKAKEALRH